jgi:nickel/cobalt exporter
MPLIRCRFLSFALVPLASVIVCALGHAQKLHHPFAVGANEGAIGPPTGLTGWLLSQESGFYLQLTAAVRSAKENGMAGFGLIGLSFAYGILHAAGPGHGKAVITSYMLAHEKVLRRGLLIAFGAAILQGAVAIAIVGTAALLLHATAQTMTEAAHLIEMASYATITLLGFGLCITKSGAFIASFRSTAFFQSQKTLDPQFSQLAFTSPPSDPCPTEKEKSRFCADNGAIAHVHGAGCGHFHAADPCSLGESFQWHTALFSIIGAGARPCSGAILVLVFALSQSIFIAGLASVLAMSAGTAITTGLLASSAVYAKNASAKWAGLSSFQKVLIGQSFELMAALAVFLLGASMLLASAKAVFSGG